MLGPRDSQHNQAVLESLEIGLFQHDVSISTHLYQSLPSLETRSSTMCRLFYPDVRQPCLHRCCDDRPQLTLSPCTRGLVHPRNDPKLWLQVLTSRKLEDIGQHKRLEYRCSSFAPKQSSCCRKCPSHYHLPTNNCPVTRSLRTGLGRSPRLFHSYHYR